MGELDIYMQTSKIEQLSHTTKNLTWNGLKIKYKTWNNKMPRGKKEGKCSLTLVLAIIFLICHTHTQKKNYKDKN